jgi:hypothetical protein
MNDHLVDETLAGLHPATLIAAQTTAGLHALMEHYASEHPPQFWATMVSAPYWREDRPAMIRALAVADTSGGVQERDALLLAELHVLALEAVAALWEPGQCRVATVWLNGKPTVSLVCNVEGCNTMRRSFATVDDVVLYLTDLEPRFTELDHEALQDVARSRTLGRYEDIGQAEIDAMFQDALALLFVEHDELSTVAECVYCGAETREVPVPAIDDDCEWDALSRHHHDDCEWVATRAHRVMD